jgi:hypothetical protein
MKQLNNNSEDGTLNLNRRFEMRKLIVMLPPLISVSIFICKLPMANAGDLSKHIGAIYSYGELPGFAFSNKKSRKAAPDYLQVLFIDGKYFLLAKEDGESHSVVVVDAASIPKGDVFIGRPMEDECVAEKFPKETIFVTGKWMNRKTEKGGFAGGYAHSISRAWRVNFEKKSSKL